GGEQSNTSATFGSSVIAKLFRRVTPGMNPDLEIGRLLTESDPLPFVPRVAGALEYRAGSGSPTTIAIVHEFIAKVGDAWTYTLDELSRYFERVQSLPASEQESQIMGADSRGILELAMSETPPLAHETIG
ncbi:alpha-amylase, partial [Lacticaseibacillus rhamnosus]